MTRILDRHRFALLGSLLVLLLLSVAVLTGCGDGDTPTTLAGGAESTGTAPTGAPAGDGKTYELKLAHFFGATHAVETDLIQPMTKEISDATGGKVKLQSYPGQTLLKGPEIYEGVVNGVADMGLSAYAYTAGRFPVVEAFLLPGFSWASAKSAGAALNDGIKQLNPAELQDTKVLFSFSTGPGHLLMKTPVRTLADLKGMEIGATAGPRGDGVRALGATPVVLPMPEVYEAQSRGIIKGVVAPYEAMTGFKLADVTDSITDMPFLYVQLFFLNVNKSSWDELPAEYQQAITTIADKYYNDVALGLFDRLNKEALEAAQAKKDIEMITWSDADQTAGKEQLQPVIEKHKQTLDGKGLDGAAIVAKVQELSDKYNAQYPKEQ